MDRREGYCVVLCILVCFGGQVGSWFGTEDMGYMAGVVAVHMRTEVVDLVGRKVWIEVVAAGDRTAWIEAEGHMTSHFAGHKPVVRDERKRRRKVADWGMKDSAGLDNHFARCSVDRLTGPGKLDSAAGHSCPAVAYDGPHDGAHDVPQAAQDYSGYRRFDLTSCCVHIMVVKWWNVKSSDHTERTLEYPDHTARAPCDPKSWYLHHLEHTLEMKPAAASGIDIAC